MRIDVHSEVGQLEQVLVHRPGAEIVRMTQHDLDRMLFDDILSPVEAAREHDMMSEIIRAAGATAHDVADLLREACEHAPKAALEVLLEQVCLLAGAPRIAKPLAQWPAERLARGLIGGVYWRELGDELVTLGRLHALESSGDPMALGPSPNLMFMRDPCISVHDRVVRGRMATSARAREPLLVAFALRYAPTTSANLAFTNDHALDESYDSVEGGDVLVLSSEFIMIGCSERTNPATLEALAKDALFRDGNLQRVYAVFMPPARSVMHLDTILTQIDHATFLGHAPLIASSDTGPGLPVARINRDGSAELVRGASVLDVLTEEFGPTTQLIPCGGDDPLHQEREQWTDGANAIALAPGKIMLYARNRYTVETLVKHGFDEVHLPLEQDANERTERVAAGMAAARTVFTFTGSELSRARGGGRCLTMPLCRKPPR